MKDIEYIELVLERDEQIVIDRKYIGLLTINKIKRKITKSRINEINDCLTVGEFAIQISKKLNEEHQEGLSGICTTFERLLHFNDITQVNIQFDDNTRDEFIIKSTEHQSAKLDINGHLYILCKKNTNVYDYFMDYIDGFKRWLCLYE